jgi:VanZ family protein
MTKPKLKAYLRAFLPSAIWAGIIFIFSSQTTLPSLHLSLLDFLFKKSAHIFVYAVLYLLLHTGLRQIDVKPQRRWWLALIFCMLYAASDEFHQSLVAGRSATVRDIGFDFLGAWLVILYKLDYL